MPNFDFLNCLRVAEVSRWEKQFPRNTNWKPFTVTTPCKVDDFSKLKIRVKNHSSHTDAAAACHTPPPLLPRPFLCEGSGNRRFAVSACWTLISVGLPAFSRTRSGERDDGRYVVKGGQAATCLRKYPACSNFYLEPWCQKASNWVESTGCFIEADLFIEVSVISVPKDPCQIRCVNQPWTVCKFTAHCEWCSSAQRLESLLSFSVHWPVSELLISGSTGCFSTLIERMTSTGVLRCCIVFLRRS